MVAENAPSELRNFARRRARVAEEIPSELRGRLRRNSSGKSVPAERFNDDEADLL